MKLAAFDHSDLACKVFVRLPPRQGFGGLRGKYEAAFGSAASIGYIVILKQNVMMMIQYQPDSNHFSG
jgi:hypothetical protein